jgi:uncharacterized membrane protein YdjX (TVP38/TMEM64 family)
MPTSAPDKPGMRPLGWRVYGPRLAVALLLVAVLAVSYALGLGGIVWDYLRSHLDLLKAEVEEHLLTALVLFFLTYLAVTALSVPVAAPLSIVAGALFGRWLGTGAVILAASIGATLAMVGSRYLFRDLVRRRFGDRLRALDDGVERDGAYYLLTLRLVPLVPFWLINLGMGLTRMRAATFFGVSLVGMLPGTFLYVNAGTELSRVYSPADVLSPTLLISLALLGIVPLLLRKTLVWRSRGTS